MAASFLDAIDGIDHKWHWQYQLNVKYKVTQWYICTMFVKHSANYISQQLFQTQRITFVLELSLHQWAPSSAVFFNFLFLALFQNWLMKLTKKMLSRRCYQSKHRNSWQSMFSYWMIVYMRCMITGCHWKPPSGIETSRHLIGQFLWKDDFLNSSLVGTTV